MAEAIRTSQWGFVVEEQNETGTVRLNDQLTKCIEECGPPGDSEPKGYCAD
ncbi:hypothetical protein J6590_066762 [Homalodisca vitripennis]|nr:hypothetical protein J6590_066762 [Homalodisca vitripennis]